MVWFVSYYNNQPILTFLSFIWFKRVLYKGMCLFVLLFFFWREFCFDVFFFWRQFASLDIFEIFFCFFFRNWNCCLSFKQQIHWLQIHLVANSWVHLQSLLFWQEYMKSWNNSNIRSIIVIRELLGEQQHQFPLWVFFFFVAKLRFLYQFVRFCLVTKSSFVQSTNWNPRLLQNNLKFGSIKLIQSVLINYQRNFIFFSTRKGQKTKWTIFVELNWFS